MKNSLGSALVIRGDNRRHSGDGLAARTERYVETFRATRDPRAAIRSYCAGNKHLEDNARGCGNM